MKNNIISGLIDAAVIILIILAVVAFWKPIDYAPIYLLNPEKALSYEHATLIDSIKCVHIEVLKDLESKYASKKEIEEIKSDIDNHKTATKGELKQDIVNSLNELMRDSISFKDSCINALYGRIEDEILRNTDKEAIDDKILKIEENIKLLFEAYDQLEEEKSSNQEIE